MTEAHLPSPHHGPYEVDQTSTRASFYVRSSKAANTVRAYRADLQDFERWCMAAGQAPMPASAATVADYIAHLVDTGARPSTITRRAAAISKGRVVVVRLELTS